MNVNYPTRHFLLLLATVTLLLSCAGAGERARMAALLEKAEQMDMEYIPLDTVTFMEEVLDFYMSHGNEDERIRANYMMGGVYRDRGDSPMALEYYLKAVNQADTTDQNCNFKKLGRIYAQMGDLYHKQRYPIKAIEMLEKAIAYAKIANDTISYLMGQSYLADAYGLLGDKKKAHELNVKSSEDFLKYGLIDYYFINSTYQLKEYIKSGRLNEAKDFLDKYFEYSHLKDSIKRKDLKSNAIYSDLGKYYEKIGKIDSAIICYRELLVNSEVEIQEDAYKGLLSAYHKKHNADSVYKYALLYTEYNDSASLLHSADEVSRVKSLYDYTHYQQKAIEKTEESNLLWKIIFFSAIVLALFSISIIIYYNKLRTKDKLRKIEIASVNRLYNRAIKELELQKGDREKFEQKKAQEVEQLKKRLDYLTDNANSSDWDNEQMLQSDQIIERFRKYARKAGNAIPVPSEWKDFNKAVETYIPDFVGKIKEFNLSDSEYKACVLTRLNFSPKDMCNLLGISSQNITNTRSSCNKKIFNEDGAKTLKNNLTMLDFA